MRVLKNDYILNWENERQQEIKDLTSKGVIPVVNDIEQKSAKGEEVPPSVMAAYRPLLMGQCAAAVKDIKPAKEIMEEMINDAVAALQNGVALFQRSKL